MHLHHLIPPWIYYLDRDALVFSRRERQRFGPAELLKPLWIDNAFECPRYLVPRLFVGEKRLGDAEGSPVVVAVKEPRSHLITACGTYCVLYGVVDVHTLHLDDILPVPCYFDFGARCAEHGEQLTGGCLLEQVAHRYIGVDVRHVDTDPRIGSAWIVRLRRAVETEACKDQFIVPALGGNT